MGVGYVGCIWETSAQIDYWMNHLQGWQPQLIRQKGAGMKLACPFRPAISHLPTFLPCHQS